MALEPNHTIPSIPGIPCPISWQGFGVAMRRLREEDPKHGWWGNLVTLYHGTLAGKSFWEAQYRLCLLQSWAGGPGPEDWDMPSS